MDKLGQMAANSGGAGGAAGGSNQNIKLSVALPVGMFQPPGGAPAPPGMGSRFANSPDAAGMLLQALRARQGVPGA